MNTPKLIEVEEFRRSVNRKIWFVIFLLCGISTFSLFLVFMNAVKPIPVVVIDSEGRPIVFSNTVTPHQTISDHRIRGFTKEFMARFVGIDSLAIKKDLTHALNMMTPTLRTILAKDNDYIRRRNKYEDANLQSRFESMNIKIGDYDERNTTDPIYLIVTGKMSFSPRLGDVQGTAEQELSQYYLTQLQIQRQPITENNPYGLLTHYVHTEFFNTEDELKLYALKKKH